MADEKFFLGYAPDGEALVRDLKAGKRWGIVVGGTRAGVVVEQLTDAARAVEPPKKLTAHDERIPGRVRRRVLRSTRSKRA